MITLLKRFAILLLIQVTAVNFIFADGGENNDLKTFYNSFLPNFQKLTPEASALGQYGKYGVSGYTGVPNISVPLFTIGSGNFSMPIELSYDASGIKVEQDATYVGLGWNLIMGGCISRIVCGQNDPKETREAPNYLTNWDLFKFTREDTTCFLRPYSYDTLRADRLTPKGQMLEDIYIGAGIPDIFQASFCGHNVSFVIEKNYTTQKEIAKIISNNATKYKINVYNLNTIEDRIEIIDDHGIQYIFTQTQEAYTGDNRLYQLSKIQNATECLVEFKYTEEALSLKKHYWETMGKPALIYDWANPEHIFSKPMNDQIRNQFINHNYPEKDDLQYTITKFYPATIITKRDTVTFAYGNREDINNGKRIDRISVKSRNKIIHDVVFNYGYFTEDSTKALCAYYSYRSYYGYKRLKLKDVIVDGKKYSFEYHNENTSLPARLSRSQDFWGYYNGAPNSNDLCASPKYVFNFNYKVLYECESVGTAVRYASEHECKFGTLSKIIYPTGGYTTFDYGLHHFNDENGRLYYPTSTSKIKEEKSFGVGDVAHNAGTNNRTKKAKNGQIYITESVFHLPSELDVRLTYCAHVKHYEEKQDINLSASVILYDDSLNQNLIEIKTTKNGQTFSVSDSIVHLKEGKYKLIAAVSHFENDLETTANIRIAYTLPPKVDENIKEGESFSVGGGLRINKIENYDSNNKLIDYTQYIYEGGKLQIPTVKTTPISLYYGFSYAGHNVQSSGSHTGHEHSFFYFVSSDSSYPEICSLGSPNVGYSKVTKKHYDKNRQLVSYDVETYNNVGYKEDLTLEDVNLFYVNIDGLNGKMKSSRTYSYDDVPMHETSYTYTTLDKPKNSKEVVFFPWCRRTFINPSAILAGFVYRFSMYTKYLTNVLPSTITETNYVNGVSMKPVTTTFEYNANNYRQAKVTKTVELNSKTKDVVTTQYWYPNDSEVNNSYPPCLTQANCISEIVKAKTFKNGNTVGGYRNVYEALSNNLPVVKENYSIDTSNSEKLELDITNYDNYGNIREYKKKDKTPVTVIWAYHHQFPVMEIVGQTYSQVKTIYTSITDLEEKNTTSEDIEKSIEALHKALLDKKVMATAYEYSPWHTVKRIIKPNGYVVNYGYDSYGRLSETKDASGILQKYSYNYKNK